MTEFEELTQSQFFIIDSENLENVQSRLYGFILTEEGNIVQEGDFSLSSVKSFGSGTYVWVKGDKKNITIEQDFDGSYGIYLFQHGDYFALSNSFWKLVDYVKERFSITFNSDYAASFISLALNSMSFSQTLIKEILMLPRNVSVQIDLKTKKLKYEELNYRENTVNLDSKEAFEIIDDWYRRWTALIRNLKAQTDNIKIDLSGGYDSRVAFIVALGANIDLNRININSSEDGLHTHCEDFDIASNIAKHFCFSLNKKLINTWTYYKDLKTPLNISWYLKAGFHKQMYWKFGYYNEPVFSLGGGGGEVINGHGMLGITAGDAFVENQVKRARTYSSLFEKPVERVMEDLLENVRHEYKVSKDCPYVTLLLYKDTISRNHFGKAKAEDLFSNTFKLQPLMDPLLRTLKTSSEECKDTRLLMTILLSRFIPDLLNFPFQGGRVLDDKTVECARKLNNKYPYEKHNLDIISEPYEELKIRQFCSLHHKNKNLSPFKRENIENRIKNTFESKKFKKIFSSVFSEQIYSRIRSIYQNKAFFPFQDVYACVASMYAAETAYYSQIRFEKNKDFFDRILTSDVSLIDSETYEFYPLLKKYATARIDIKNYGKKRNDIQVLSLSSEDNVKVESPMWFNNEMGQGFLIQSHSGTLDLKLKCISSGELKFFCRGVDSRDKNGVRFPVWIDYTNFTVDQKIVFEKSHLVCYDKPYIYEMKVTDGQIVELHIEWQPFDCNSVIE